MAAQLAATYTSVLRELAVGREREDVNVTMPSVTMASATVVFFHILQSASCTKANVGKRWCNVPAITHSLFIGINHQESACAVQIK